MTRDIPFDEEVAERSDRYRDTFGAPTSREDMEAARRKWSAEMDRLASAPFAALGVPAGLLR